MGDKFENWLCETVERVGWAVLSVAPQIGGNDPEEWFSYTIGLAKTFGWPELICFGLGRDDRQFILNDAVEECRDRAIVPAQGVRLSNILNDFDVLLSEGSHIPPHYLNSANWFAKSNGLSTPVARLQLLWPDKDGHFPGDEACSASIVTEQTPLETL